MQLFAREDGLSLRSHADAIGIDESLLGKYRRVAAAYGPENRNRFRLSWSHFEVAVRQPDRVDWLERAQDQVWSKRDLQKALKKHVQQEQPPIPVPQKPYVRLGDLFDIGAHRVLCADAGDESSVDALLDGATADMLFTDPPYGVDYEGKTDDQLTILGDDLDDADLYELVSWAFRAARARLRPGSAFYVCAPSGNRLPVLWATVEDDIHADEDDPPGPLGEIRQAIVWAKDRFVLGRQDMHWGHELLLYGWTSGASHRWYGGDDQSTVWDIARPTRNDEHPTKKPVELAFRAILNSTEQGEVVLDPFLGSGTTLEAAHRSKRRGFGIELDPRYAQVAIESLERETEQKAIYVRNVLEDEAA